MPLRTRPAIYELTEREADCAELVCRGMANKEIARELGLSTITVKNHLNHAFQKLHVENRTQLAVLVFTRGVIRAPRLLGDREKLDLY